MVRREGEVCCVFAEIGRQEWNESEQGNRCGWVACEPEPMPAEQPVVQEGFLGCLW